MNYENVKRYNPELDYTHCYYEADPPDISFEESSYGKVVMYSDYLSLLNAYLTLKSNNE